MFFSLFLFLLLVNSSRQSNDNYAESIGSAILISLNTAVQGTISCGGDVDYFKLQLVAGRTYKISLEALTSDYFDDHLTFYDSSGSELTYNDDSSGQNAQISYTISSTGTYYVQASGFNGGQCGSYVLAVMDTSSCSDSCASNEILLW